MAARMAGSSTALPLAWKTTLMSSPARAGKLRLSRSCAFWDSDPGVLKVKWLSPPAVLARNTTPTKSTIHRARTRRRRRYDQSASRTSRLGRAGLPSPGRVAVVALGVLVVVLMTWTPRSLFSRSLLKRRDGVAKRDSSVGRCGGCHGQRGHHL